MFRLSNETKTDIAMIALQHLLNHLNDNIRAGRILDKLHLGAHRQQEVLMLVLQSRRPDVFNENGECLLSQDQMNDLMDLFKQYAMSVGCNSDGTLYF